jgi:acetate kinase
MSHDKGSAVQLHVTQAEYILHTQVGWKALVGTTDFIAITAQRTDEAAWLAFELFADRVLNYVGSYHLKLGSAWTHWCSPVELGSGARSYAC